MPSDNTPRTDRSPLGRLLPARAPDEYLKPANPDRIQCFAHLAREGKIGAIAVGCEQTRIVYALTQIIAGFEQMNITALTTSRLPILEASTHLSVAALDGGAEARQAFLQEVNANPWFEPGGRPIEPERLIDLDVCAPDRPKLLRDLTRIISVDHETNIETMVNRVYPRDPLMPPTFAPQSGGDGFLSFTRMKLELGTGTNLQRMKRDLEKLGKEFMFRWGELRKAPRPGEEVTPLIV